MVKKAYSQSFLASNIGGDFVSCCLCQKLHCTVLGVRLCLRSGVVVDSETSQSSVLHILSS